VGMREVMIAGILRRKQRSLNA